MQLSIAEFHSPAGFIFLASLSLFQVLVGALMIGITWEGSPEAYICQGTKYPVRIWLLAQMARLLLATWASGCATARQRTAADTISLLVCQNLLSILHCLWLAGALAILSFTWPCEATRHLNASAILAADVFLLWLFIACSVVTLLLPILLCASISFAIPCYPISSVLTRCLLWMANFCYDTRHQHVNIAPYAPSEVGDRIVLSQREFIVSKLPYRVHAGSIDHTLPSDQSQCGICLSDYEMGEPLATLPCQHVFHHECVSAWLRGGASLSCPLCREDLTAMAWS